MRALVTGGSGRLGNVLCRELLARGDSVTALDPGAHSESLRDLELNAVRGSVLDADTVDAAVAQADCVFHLAAKLDLTPDRDGSTERVNVEGTRVVAEACRKHAVRMVHTSSHHALDIYPLSEPLDETRSLALKHKCDYHRTKAIGETVVQAACDDGLDAVIVNPGSMLGPHDFEPSMIGRALLDLYHGRTPMLLDVLSDYVDVRDVAQGMMGAAEHGQTGERYLLTGHVIPIDQMTGVFGKVSGRPMPKRCAPLWVGWALLPLVTAGSKLAGKPSPFNANMLRVSVSNDVVSHDKAASTFGYQLRPIEETFADALAFYETQGWLDKGAKPPVR